MLARDWVEPARDAVADMRAAEIAVCIAGHIRTMGFPARAHFTGHTLSTPSRLAVLAGLAVRDRRASANPYIGERFRACGDHDRLSRSRSTLPLHVERSRPRASPTGGAINGAQSGRERNRRAQPRHPSQPLSDGDGQARRAADDADPRRRSAARAQARRILRACPARRSRRQGQDRTQRAFRSRHRCPESCCR